MRARIFEGVWNGHPPRRASAQPSASKCGARVVGRAVLARCSRARPVHAPDFYGQAGEKFVVLAVTCVAGLIFKAADGTAPLRKTPIGFFVTRLSPVPPVGGMTSV